VKAEGPMPRMKQLIVCKCPTIYCWYDLDEKL